ncbi:MAG: hypothetical protein QOI30_3050, partial [Mycobacterium sp.]|nr:hypothetical protein [Mycobacterium sp.]
RRVGNGFRVGHARRLGRVACRRIGQNGHPAASLYRAPGSAVGGPPASARHSLIIVRLVGVSGRYRQLRPARLVVGCVNQIQQSLKTEHPAQPLGPIADRGLETASQLALAQGDLGGQLRNRGIRCARNAATARATGRSTTGSAAAKEPRTRFVNSDMRWPGVAALSIFSAIRKPAGPAITTSPWPITNTSTQPSGITRIDGVAEPERSQPHSTKGRRLWSGRNSRYTVSSKQPLH